MKPSSQSCPISLCFFFLFVNLCTFSHPAIAQKHISCNVCLCYYLFPWYSTNPDREISFSCLLKIVCSSGSASELHHWSQSGIRFSLKDTLPTFHFQFIFISNPSTLEPSNQMNTQWHFSPCHYKNYFEWEIICYCETQTAPSPI